MREHFTKKPECKILWDDEQQHQFNGAATVETSQNDDNSNLPSVVWSNDDALDCNDTSSKELLQKEFTMTLLLSLALARL